MKANLKTSRQQQNLTKKKYLCILQLGFPSAIRTSWRIPPYNSSDNTKIGVQAINLISCHVSDPSKTLRSTISETLSSPDSLKTSKITPSRRTPYKIQFKLNHIKPFDSLSKPLRNHYSLKAPQNDRFSIVPSFRLRQCALWQRH